MGEVLRYIPFAPVLTQAPLAEGTQGQAWDQYLATKEKAKGELGALEQRMAQTDPEKAKIMAAHQEILADPAMDDEIRGLVMEQLCSPDAAIAQIYDTYAAILTKSKNALMRERASDLQDVKRRLLRCWAGAPEQNLSTLAKPVIVVADDLFPSDTASLDRARVLGIVTQVGGSTSHTAIIARSYEIPAVLGVTGAMDALADGQFIVLDAVEGRVIPNPTEEEITRYSQQAAQLQAELQITKAYRDKLPVTLDGHRVEVHLNVAAATEQELAGAAFADGCGLFRTEFLYTSSQGLPDETQQFQIYKKVLTAFGDKPVTLRTMDIGGDKQVPCLDLPKESNPFLGVRGLRLSLSKPELFRTQIRAALRASAHGKLQIMMPMVGALDEVYAAKAIIQAEGEKLDAQGIPWDHAVPIGIMVEIPSIALIADRVAEEVDFVSVGTNDLIQYLCAADRMNPGVRPYYQDYHPALFRLLDILSQTFREAGKPLSICGELGSDPLAIPALVGLGIQKLSMGAAAIAGAKRVIRNLDLPQAQAMPSCQGGTDGVGVTLSAVGLQITNQNQTYGYVVDDLHTIALRLADGTEQVIVDDANAIDQTLYALGTEDGKTVTYALAQTFALDQVTAVVLNGTAYPLH